eukprot:UN04717
MGHCIRRTISKYFRLAILALSGIVLRSHGAFFREEIWGTFHNMANVFTCMCPNRSEVGANDSLDRFEQVF